jgi:hypothetical protein
MWQSVLAIILGFTLAGFISVLLGYSESFWEGKGVIAFAYLGLLLLCALILNVMLLRNEIHRSVMYRAQRHSTFLVVIGAMSYPIANTVAFLVPNWMGSLGLESVAWLLSVLVGEIILISILLICSTIIAIRLNCIFD